MLSSIYRASCYGKGTLAESESKCVLIRAVREDRMKQL
jgi:hypothetical protein